MSKREFRVCMWLALHAESIAPLTKAVIGRDLNMQPGDIGNAANDLGDKRVIVNIGTAKAQDLRLSPHPGFWRLENSRDS